jgi:hypothetical protein
VKPCQIDPAGQGRKSQLEALSTQSEQRIIESGEEMSVEVPDALVERCRTWSMSFENPKRANIREPSEFELITYDDQ